jgi:hypothetical protein
MRSLANRCVASPILVEQFPTDLSDWKGPEGDMISGRVARAWRGSILNTGLGQALVFKREKGATLDDYLASDNSTAALHEVCPSHE